MLIIDTRELDEKADKLSDSEIYWVYNALDCCVTYDVLLQIEKQLDDVSRATYNTSMATIPADLLDAVQHIAKLGTSGPQWGFQQDLEMIERAIDGQTEKLIADVMDFSQSHIRQRFNKLVDRIHARGNSFTREQIRDALKWILGKTHTAF